MIARLGRGVVVESARCSASTRVMSLSTQAPQGTFIRPAKIEDVGTLHGIIHASYRTTDSWTTEHHLVSGERISQDGIKKLIEDDVDRIFVAGVRGEEDSPPAGCICAELVRNHPDVDLPNDHAMLGLFAVDPKHQSRGVGTQLLSHALDYIKEEGSCRFATIWVIEQREDIIAWYERKGFVHTGKRIPFVFPDLALVSDMHFKVMQKAL